MTLDAADLAAFNDPDLPGYALATINGAGVHGRFRQSDAEALGFVGGTSPSFSAASTDLSAVVEGTAVTINSVSYTVAEIHPDGTGMTRLKLETA